jgi:hypothetical protein
VPFAILLTVVAIWLIPTSVDASPAAAPRFTAEDDVAASEGHATLAWTVDAKPGNDLVFELQQSRSRDFSNHRVVHDGVEDAYFVSGLREGATYFRVRAVRSDAGAGPWSETLVVRVEYPGRGQVVVLLAAGFVVLAATVAAVVFGFLRSRA